MIGFAGTGAANTAADNTNGDQDEDADEDALDAGALASPEPSGVVLDAAVDNVLPADAGSVLPAVDPNDVLVAPDGSVSFGFDANFPP